jgi:hypothetical protein
MSTDEDGGDVVKGLTQFDLPKTGKPAQSAFEDKRVIASSKSTERAARSGWCR